MIQSKKLRHKELSPLTVVHLQADGTLGIDNIKTVLTVLVTFLVDLLTIIKSGNWLRLVEVLFGIIRYGNIVAIAQAAWEEFKDVSQPESEQLVAHFAETFDLENDVTEQAIEQALSTIPRIYALVIRAWDIVAEARELFQEIKDIFNGEGQLAELSRKVAA